jgi:hypothetical protein
VQDYVEQCAVDLQPGVVVNKTQLPEPVHEEVIQMGRGMQ